MKKAIFCVVAAIAVLTSCEQKAEPVQLVDDIYTEQIAGENPGFKLRSFNGSTYYSVSEEIYAKISFDKENNFIKAEKAGGGFDLYKVDANRLGSDTYDSMEAATGKAVFIKKGERTALYLPEKGFFFGPYASVKLEGNLIFACGTTKWGLLNTNYDYLQDMVFDKLYVINQKSEKEYDVLRCRDGKWSMVTASGAEYEDGDVKAAVKWLEKTAKPKGPVGTL